MLMLRPGGRGEEADDGEANQEVEPEVVKFAS
jgi:hypothetical protein